MLLNPLPTAATWTLDNNDRLVFADRSLIGSSSEVLENTSEYRLEKVSYTSFGDKVYGLLRVPDNVSNPPVVIVLPAASINKEADQDMAKALCSWGYASLTLDERGNKGETPGPSPMDTDRGYYDFTHATTPVQYKQIYDVLAGYDYLKSRQDLDHSNVSVLGESMGGRFAILSAAIDPGLKTAFVISSGPYGLKSNGEEKQTKFINSIEPANYISVISPGKVVMFHFTNDTIIPVESGRALYDLAGEPKAWYEYNGTVHGLYSDVYAPDLRAELRGVFGR